MASVNCLMLTLEDTVDESHPWLILSRAPVDGTVIKTIPSRRSWYYGPANGHGSDGQDELQVDNVQGNTPVFRLAGGRG